MENEVLAVADALNKTRLRLCNFKEKTLRYHFRMVHIPGVKNMASDAISRHPTSDQTTPKMRLMDDDIFHISHLQLSPDSPAAVGHNHALTSL